MLLKKRGGPDFLESKVLLGSMNRTGLAGTEHEMMDRTSSYMTGKRIKEMHLDGAKLLWRWVPTGEKNDRYAIETLERVAKAVEELAELNLPAFVEPLPVKKTETGYKTDLTTDNIIKACGIASALGYYTGHVWLKIPYCEDFARVAKASSFPILLLGGESTGQPSGTIEDSCAVWVPGRTSGAPSLAAMGRSARHFQGLIRQVRTPQRADNPRLLHGPSCP